VSSTISIPNLRGTFNGRVIGPDDEHYDRARTVFYGGYDRRPRAIIRPADAEEVARVVALAGDSGLPLAVRSGGHSIAGHGVCDDGIVLDLSGMQAMEIDADRQTAQAQTGLTTGYYTKAVSGHGLATPFGDTGSVGIGGITLGGGLGYLGRKHGLTVDSLLAAEVVTADGKVLTVDADNHPDLFWAIRGGGGNFGVATRFTFRLHEVDTVVGGMLVLPANPGTIEGFVAAAAAAPNELSAIAAVMLAPPMPFLPPEVHGKLIIFATMCFAGPIEAGERAMAPFRALATPLVDMVEPRPYLGIFQPEEGAEEFHPVAASMTMFVDRIDAAGATTILDRLGDSDAQMRVAQLRALGGAIADVPADATAYAHRQAPIMVNIAALCADTDEAAARMPWVAGFASALNQGNTGAYVGFLGDEGADRVRAAYPGPTWDRLRAIKAIYDPTNLFRGNQNIPPADPEA
jgi:FAD/FMN-containing dehydrogenase